MGQDLTTFEAWLDGKEIGRGVSKGEGEGRRKEWR